MARNIEIKARIHDLDRVRSKTASLASGPSRLIEQTDTFFAVPHGRLKVREFADGSAELISYDRPDRPGPKESVFSRVAFSDGRAAVQTLASVLPTRGTVVKRRELFLIGRTRVHLDRVEGLGVFLELEVVMSDGEPSERGDREARQLLAALEIPESDLIERAYIDLLEGART
jgi:adenylate cyclase class IV